MAAAASYKVLMKMRYSPTFNDLREFYEMSDEEKIRLEANIRSVIESLYRVTRETPIPPSFEEMKFDGDRGL